MSGADHRLQILNRTLNMCSDKTLNYVCAKLSH